MRRGTLLALGGLGALTHSIIWHQIETDSPPVRPLPVIGAVPERAPSGEPELVVRSCVVEDGTVTIDAVATNSSDEMRWFRGIDYRLLDANGDVVEGIGSHDPFESAPLQVGAHRRIHVVDSNPARTGAAKCVPAGIIDSRPYASTPDGVPADVTLSGCVDDAMLTARNPTDGLVGLMFVIEYFDAEGFSLGRISYEDRVEAGASASMPVGYARQLTVGGTPLTASGEPAGCEVAEAAYEVDPAPIRRAQAIER